MAAISAELQDRVWQIREQHLILKSVLAEIQNHIDLCVELNICPKCASALSPVSLNNYELGKSATILWCQVCDIAVRIYAYGDDRVAYKIRNATSQWQDEAPYVTHIDARSFFNDDFLARQDIEKMLHQNPNT